MGPGGKNGRGGRHLSPRGRPPASSARRGPPLAAPDTSEPDRSPTRAPVLAQAGSGLVLARAKWARTNDGRFWLYQEVRDEEDRRGRNRIPCKHANRGDRRVEALEESREHDARRSGLRGCLQPRRPHVVSGDLSRDCVGIGGCYALLLCAPTAKGSTADRLGCWGAETVASANRRPPWKDHGKQRARSVANGLATGRS
jgi:hypothetical protein